MTSIDSVILFSVMFVLALIPSSSVLLVTTRTLSNGVASGVAVALGIVAGDLIFVSIALFGLAFLTERLSGWSDWGYFLAAIYLVWVAVGTFKQASSSVQENKAEQSSFTSFFAGLLLTLADVKAIVFYLSLLPAFVDLSVLTTYNIVAIILITVLSVGSAKLSYVYWVDKVSHTAVMIKKKSLLMRLCACLLVVVAVWLCVQVV